MPIELDEPMELLDEEPLPPNALLVPPNPPLDDELLAPLDEPLALDPPKRLDV